MAAVTATDLRGASSGESGLARPIDLPGASPRLYLASCQSSFGLFCRALLVSRRYGSSSSALMSSPCGYLCRGP